MPSFPETISTPDETTGFLEPRARLLRLIGDLPAVIAVPSVLPDEDDDPLYRPLFGPKGATIGELRVAVNALWQSIALEQRKAIALNNLLLLVSAGDVTDDTRLTEALQRIAGAAA
jgi:hypothetical protein